MIDKHSLNISMIRFLPISSVFTTGWNNL